MKNAPPFAWTEPFGSAWEIYVGTRSAGVFVDREPMEGLAMARADTINRAVKEYIATLTPAKPRAGKRRKQ